MESRYRVVSYGSYRTDDTDGIREHGQFDDSSEAIRMAQLVIEASLRQDAVFAKSADELGKRYWDFGIVPVIWGEPKPEFEAHAYAVQAASVIWDEYLGRLAHQDAASREVQWEQAKARQDKILLVRALSFASKKHRDQRRKDAMGSPYINHPIALARILAEEGGVTDTQILCAALLHDTLEDTDTSAGELVTEFGAVVAGVVAEVTDDKSLPKAERKRLQIEHAASISRRAKLVKLADKIDNLRDMASSPPADWSLERRQEYFDWAKAVIDELRGVHPRLESIFDEAYRGRPTGEVPGYSKTS
jgi:GTP diphosphokinase / guanosine-3',5'-bis(diphosphate) 3'-diphosphatase